MDRQPPCYIFPTPFIVPFVVFAFVVPPNLTPTSTFYIYSNSISNFTYSITSRYLELGLVELLKLRLNLNWGFLPGAAVALLPKWFILFLFLYSYIYSYIYFYS